MKTLFIDTSSEDVSIACFNDDKIIYSINKNITNNHSVYTIPYIQECLEKSNLKPQDINKIIAINGPGSFTGIRIGLTIAKIYSYLQNINVITISSLKSLSLSNKGKGNISIIDARNDNYYIGIYDENNKNVIEEQFINKKHLLPLINKYNNYELISNKSFAIDDYKTKEITLNFENIYNFLKNEEGVNNFQVNPNYLKLPQALEEKND